MRQCDEAASRRRRREGFQFWKRENILNLKMWFFFFILGNNNHNYYTKSTNTPKKSQQHIYSPNQKCRTLLVFLFWFLFLPLHLHYMHGNGNMAKWVFTLNVVRVHIYNSYVMLCVISFVFFCFHLLIIIMFFFSLK